MRKAKCRGGLTSTTAELRFDPGSLTPEPTANHNLSLGVLLSSPPLNYPYFKRNFTEKKNLKIIRFLLFAPLQTEPFGRQGLGPTVYLSLDVLATQIRMRGMLFAAPRLTRQHNHILSNMQLTSQDPTLQSLAGLHLTIWPPSFQPAAQCQGLASQTRWHLVLLCLGRQLHLQIFGPCSSVSPVSLSLGLNTKPSCKGPETGLLPGNGEVFAEVIIFSNGNCTPNAPPPPRLLQKGQGCWWSGGPGQAVFPDNGVGLVGAHCLPATLRHWTPPRDPLNKRPSSLLTSLSGFPSCPLSSGSQGGPPTPALEYSGLQSWCPGSKDLARWRPGWLFQGVVGGGCQVVQ